MKGVYFTDKSSPAKLSIKIKQVYTVSQADIPDFVLPYTVSDVGLTVNVTADVYTADFIIENDVIKGNGRYIAMRPGQSVNLEVFPAPGNVSNGEIRYEIFSPEEVLLPTYSDGEAGINPISITAVGKENIAGLCYIKIWSLDSVRVNEDGTEQPPTVFVELPIFVSNNPTELDEIFQFSVHDINYGKKNSFGGYNYVMKEEQSVNFGLFFTDGATESVKSTIVANRYYIDDLKTITGIDIMPYITKGNSSGQGAKLQQVMGSGSFKVMYVKLVDRYYIELTGNESFNIGSIRFDVFEQIPYWEITEKNNGRVAKKEIGESKNNFAFEVTTRNKDEIIWSHSLITQYNFDYDKSYVPINESAGIGKMLFEPHLTAGQRKYRIKALDIAIPIKTNVGIIDMSISQDKNTIDGHTAAKYDVMIRTDESEFAKIDFNGTTGLRYEFRYSVDNDSYSIPLEFEGDNGTARVPLPADMASLVFGRTFELENKIYLGDGIYEYHFVIIVSVSVGISSIDPIPVIENGIIILDDGNLMRTAEFKTISQNVTAVNFEHLSNTNILGPGRLFVDGAQSPSDKIYLDSKSAGTQVRSGLLLVYATPYYISIDNFKISSDIYINNIEVGKDKNGNPIIKKEYWKIDFQQVVLVNGTDGDFRTPPSLNGGKMNSYQMISSVDLDENDHTIAEYWDGVYYFQTILSQDFSGNAYELPKAGTEFPIHVDIQSGANVIRNSSVLYLDNYVPKTIDVPTEAVAAKTENAVQAIGTKKYYDFEMTGSGVEVQYNNIEIYGADYSMVDVIYEKTIDGFQIISVTLNANEGLLSSGKIEIRIPYTDDYGFDNQFLRILITPVWFEVKDFYKDNDGKFKANVISSSATVIKEQVDRHLHFFEETVAKTIFNDEFEVAFYEDDKTNYFPAFISYNDGVAVIGTKGEYLIKGYEQSSGPGNVGGIQYQQEVLQAVGTRIAHDLPLINERSYVPLSVRAEDENGDKINTIDVSFKNDQIVVDLSRYDGDLDNLCFVRIDYDIDGTNDTHTIKLNIRAMTVDLVYISGHPDNPIVLGMDDKIELKFLPWLTSGVNISSSLNGKDIGDLLDEWEYDYEYVIIPGTNYNHKYKIMKKGDPIVDVEGNQILDADGNGLVYAEDTIVRDDKTGIVKDEEANFAIENDILYRPALQLAAKTSYLKVTVTSRYSLEKRVTIFTIQTPEVSAAPSPGVSSNDLGNLAIGLSKSYEIPVLNAINVSASYVENAGIGGFAISGDAMVGTYTNCIVTIRDRIITVKLSKNVAAFNKKIVINIVYDATINSYGNIYSISITPVLFEITGVSIDGYENGTMNLPKQWAEMPLWIKVEANYSQDVVGAEDALRAFEDNLNLGRYNDLVIMEIGNDHPNITLGKLSNGRYVIRSNTEEVVNYIMYSFKISYDNLPVPVVVGKNDDGESFLGKLVIWTESGDAEDWWYPIYYAEQLSYLSNLSQGKNYILMDDITVSGWQGNIVASGATFDGNNHKIFIDSFATAGNGNIGLFDTIEAGAVVKNVSVVIPRGNETRRDIEKTITAAVGSRTAPDEKTDIVVSAGLLAGINNGIVTNCAVLSEWQYYYKNGGALYLDNNGKEVAGYDDESNAYGAAKFVVLVDQLNSGMTINVGGLIGLNQGNVTNSRVLVSVSLGGTGDAKISNVGGFIGVNQPLSNAALTDANKKLDETHQIASSGNITASFFSDGNVENNLAFRDSTDKVQATASYVGGFVGSNSGKIRESYVTGKSIDTFGDFALPTEGWVYSTKYSIAGFVGKNNVTGDISDCKVSILTALIGESTFSSGFVMVNAGTITRSIANNSIPNTGDELFRYGHAFAPASQTGTFNNCYFTGDSSRTWFNENVVNKIDNNAYQNISTYSGYSISAASNYTVWSLKNGGYPELIAAKDIVVSIHEMQNEAVKYYLGPTKDISGYIYGSSKNPRIIGSEADFKREFIGDNISNKSYRLAADINLSSAAVSLNLTLANCYIDGNGFTISNISVYQQDDTKKTSSIGLFSKLDESVIRDLNLKMSVYSPSKNQKNKDNASVVGPSAVFAGGLAGVSVNTSLVDISISNVTSDTSIIQGQNIVGGLIGIVVNNKAKVNNRDVEIYNIKSSVGVLTTWSFNKTNTFTDGVDYNQMPYYSNTTVNAQVVERGMDVGGGIFGIVTANPNYYYKEGSGLVSRDNTVGGIFDGVNQFQTIDESKYMTMANLTFSASGSAYENIAASVIGGGIGIVDNYVKIQNIKQIAPVNLYGRFYLGGVVGINLGVIKDVSIHASAGPTSIGTVSVGVTDNLSTTNNKKPTEEEILIEGVSSPRNIYVWNENDSQAHIYMYAGGVVGYNNGKITVTGNDGPSVIRASITGGDGFFSVGGVIGENGAAGIIGENGSSDTLDPRLQNAHYSLSNSSPSSYPSSGVNFGKVVGYSPYLLDGKMPIMRAEMSVSGLKKYQYSTLAQYLSERIAEAKNVRNGEQLWALINHIDPYFQSISRGTGNKISGKGAIETYNAFINTVDKIFGVIPGDISVTYPKPYNAESTILKNDLINTYLRYTEYGLDSARRTKYTDIPDTDPNFIRDVTEISNFAMSAMSDAEYIEYLTYKRNKGLEFDGNKGTEKLGLSMQQFAHWKHAKVNVPLDKYHDYVINFGAYGIGDFGDTVFTLWVNSGRPTEVKDKEDFIEFYNTYLSLNLVYEWATIEALSPADWEIEQEGGSGTNWKPTGTTLGNLTSIPSFPYGSIYAYKSVTVGDNDDPGTVEFAFPEAYNDNRNGKKAYWGTLYEYYLLKLEKSGFSIEGYIFYLQMGIKQGMTDDDIFYFIDKKNTYNFSPSTMASIYKAAPGNGDPASRFGSYFELWNAVKGYSVTESTFAAAIDKGATLGEYNDFRSKSAPIVPPEEATVDNYQALKPYAYIIMRVNNGSLTGTTTLPNDEGKPATWEQAFKNLNLSPTQYANYCELYTKYKGVITAKNYKDGATVGNLTYTTLDLKKDDNYSFVTYTSSVDDMVYYYVLKEDGLQLSREDYIEWLREYKYNSVYDQARQTWLTLDAFTVWKRLQPTRDVLTSFTSDGQTV
ncbi:MAG: hypothetical protein LBH47_03565, partial [Christensenellaceae bacterium]|nr:hypothetical protein [Christensenellaceae bacterium]